MPALKWYDSRENLARLLEWLDKQGEASVEISWMTYYLEKPWKWQVEWGKFLAANPEYRQ